MVTDSFNTLLPYITLGLLVAGLFVVRSSIVLSFLLALEIVYAYINGIIDPIGLLAIAAFWGLCTIHWRNLSANNSVNLLRTLILATVAIVFANHMVPGFNNLRAISGELITPTSVPFTMYLNFDKTVAAIVLALSSGLLIGQAKRLTLKTWGETVLISLLCISLLIPLAVLSGYVNYEPKLPHICELWACNNLVFVAFAEEVIFRGVIQKHLAHLFNRWNISPYVAILISALLFAITLSGHRQGGFLFMGFVALSGLFYGYAYHRTQRLEAAILVHFLVNLFHFLFFSYPMAASVVR
jgi:uncharacterized protein